jgi:hypothetical protein
MPALIEVRFRAKTTDRIADGRSEIALIADLKQSDFSHTKILGFNTTR